MHPKPNNSKICEQAICDDVDKKVLQRIESVNTLFLCIGSINITLAIAAVFLNLTIIVSFIVSRKLRKFQYTLIFNLCLVDALIAVIVQLPIGGNQTGVFRLPCELLKPSGHVLTWISFLTVVAISVDRFVSVFHPYLHPRLVTPRNVTICLITLWVLPVTLGILVHVSVLCPKHLILPTAVSSLTFSILLIAGHLRMFIIIRRIRRQIRHDNARFRQEDACRNRRITAGVKGMRFTIATIITLLLCYFPYAMLNLVKSPSSYHEYLIALHVSLSLALLPAVLNPILMLCTVTEVRGGVMKLFKIRVRGIEA